VQLAALLLLYKAVRYWSRDQFALAVDNARQVMHLEHTLRVPREVDLTSLSLRWPGFVRFLNQYYVLAHFSVTAIFLIWMFARRPLEYPMVRRVLIWMTAIGMVLHVIYPLAPPRMFPELGFIDTGRLFGPRAYGDEGLFDGVSNQIAAMPSLHFGWAVLVAWAVVRFTRTRWRWLAVAHPLLTLLAIIVTANHYWMDAFVALLIFIGCAAGVAWRAEVKEAKRAAAAVVGVTDVIDVTDVVDVVEVRPAPPVRVHDRPVLVRERPRERRSHDGPPEWSVAHVRPPPR
jgi:hypothetical protein